LWPTEHLSVRATNIQTSMRSSPLNGGPARSFAASGRRPSAGEGSPVMSGRNSHRLIAS
jgi:hypothetical protein